MSIGRKLNLTHGSMAVLVLVPLLGAKVVLKTLQRDFSSLAEQTLEALRTMPGFGSIPVVSMTAKTMRPEVEFDKKLGAVDAIPMPFDPMTLADQLRAIWKNHNG